MVRMPIYHLLVIVPAMLMLSVSLYADSDWIAPGTFIEWPDSLKETSDLPQLLSRPDPEVIQTQFTDPLILPEEPQLFVEQQPQLFIETSEPFGEPSPEFLPQLSTTQLNQVQTETWQVLPTGLLFHNYLAGEKEPRTAATWLWDKNRGLVWEAAVGSRWGLLRHGTQGTNAEGFQFDVEGAALVRIDPRNESDLEAADFRAGFVGTWRKGPWRWKTGYYHISSHVGDEYLIRNPTYVRVNYVRDSWLGAVMYDITPELQTYGEIGYAIGAEGGAEPVEFQFGVQYSPAVATGWRGAPFGAINSHLRQELDFGGSINVEAGWAWRGGASNSLFRAGFQHYNGNSMQWSFVDRYESMTGMGIWFDF